MSEKQLPVSGDRTDPSGEKAIAASEARDLAVVRDALRGLKFGSVTLFVQDGVIVQVERTEKIRIQRVKPE